MVASLTFCAQCNSFDTQLFRRVADGTDRKPCTAASHGRSQGGDCLAESTFDSLIRGPNTSNPAIHTGALLPNHAVPSAVTDPIALLFPELDTELAVTRTILGIVPWEHAEWKPHPRSGTLGKLATHVAQLPNFATTMATMDVLHFNPEDFKPAPVTSTAELVALFDTEAAKMRAALATLDHERLNGSWKMLFGGNAMIDNQRAFLLRHMGINHLVHHRAQLGVYLRLLDVKIPGSYGPSADT